MTSKTEINRWLDKLYSHTEYSHMIVVCDTFDWEDYPVYVEAGTDPQKIVARYTGNMQKVMEVYSRNKSRESQLKTGRAFNFD